MPTSPLIPPREQESLALFLKQFGLRADTEPHQLLREVATAFARLPYENLTKIIKGHELANPAQARRLPEEVVRDHLAFGTGGTCFSLTATLLHLVGQSQICWAEDSFGRWRVCGHDRSLPARALSAFRVDVSRFP